MTTAKSRQSAPRDVVAVAWERRLRAAWIDYLRIVQDSHPSEYDQVEQNAWEQLQRRLRRNDELRDAAVPTVPAAQV